MNKLKKITTLFLLLFSVVASAMDSSITDDIGDLVQKGDAAALVKLKQGADNGDVESEVLLGEYFLTQKDGKKQAVEWFKKTADQGNWRGQLDLGYCYANGLGIEKDNNQALIWYTKSALQGNLDAQKALGTFYRYVLANDKQAIIWLTKAADHGGSEHDDESRILLGDYYYFGDGVGKNEVISYALYDLADDHQDLLNTDWNLTKSQIKTAKVLKQRMFKIGVSSAIDEYLKSVHESK
ncbi:MAG: tetratricopeptide repeat protein [Sulfuriferula sp.]|nr:tetratricopeptide repeat protein [Sulfuriferula sp.]